jgi:polar amino acid transport system permease protein
MGTPGGPKYQWDLTVVRDYFPVLVSGLQLTFFLTITSLGLSLILGLIVAMIRVAKVWVLNPIAIGYIEFVRATPLLIQLVWIYYSLPIILNIQIPSVWAAIIAITLNLGAFAAEAFRSGLQAVPRDQIDAADVLGLGYLHRMQYVVVPQAFRIILPVLISLSVTALKDTALVSTLGIAELMYQGHTVASQTYRPLEILTTVALIYFVIAFPFTTLSRRLERHLARHLRTA